MNEGGNCTATEDAVHPRALSFFRENTTALHLTSQSSHDAPSTPFCLFLSPTWILLPLFASPLRNEPSTSRYPSLMRILSCSKFGTALTSGKAIVRPHLSNLYSHGSFPCFTQQLHSPLARSLPDNLTFSFFDARKSLATLLQTSFPLEWQKLSTLTFCEMPSRNKTYKASDTLT